MSRDKIEALEAIQSALEGKKYTGDYVFTCFKENDVNLYCTTVKAEEGIGRLIAIVWQETQAGITSTYVDISPVLENDEPFMVNVQNTIEAYIDQVGFSKTLEVADTWASWKKEISSIR